MRVGRIVAQSGAAAAILIVAAAPDACRIVCSRVLVLGELRVLAQVRWQEVAKIGGLAAGMNVAVGP